MPPIKILRLKRYKGGSFLSELGRYSRPILRILAKHAKHAFGKIEKGRQPGHT